MAPAWQRKYFGLPPAERRTPDGYRTAARLAWDAERERQRQRAEAFDAEVVAHVRRLGERELAERQPR
jgi:hypothetical protein